MAARSSHRYPYASQRCGSRSASRARRQATGAEAIRRSRTLVGLDERIVDVDAWQFVRVVSDPLLTSIERARQSLCLVKGDPFMSMARQPLGVSTRVPRTKQLSSPQAKNKEVTRGTRGSKLFMRRYEATCVPPNRARVLREKT